MRAGELRHKITIEQCTETADSFGQPTLAWSPLAAAVWASIEPLSGRELFNARQVQPDTTHRVRLRGRLMQSTTSKMRVAFGSRYLNILSVRDVEERGIETELMCVEAA